MRKFKTALGYYAYEVTAEEIIFSIKGSKAVCDHCNEYADTGFLVPVLNHYICPSCFEKWASKGKYYPSDQEAEQSTCRYYEDIFRVNKPCRICGVEHLTNLPHYPRTEEFVTHVKAAYGREPIWADTVEHCDQDFRDSLDEILKSKGYKKGLEGAIEYGSDNSN